MAARNLILGAALLLNSGCVQVEEPVVPELKGHWASDNVARVRHALLTYPPAEAPQSIRNTDCSTQFVSFGKRYITLHTHDVIPLLVVREIKRDGNRITLTGVASVPGGDGIQVDLVLRNGDVRVDDVRDRRGRSVLYERLNKDQAQQAGINTIGDVFRLALDAKPCRA